MLLTASEGAIAKLDLDVYRQVRLWTITRVDGWIRRYTDHNRRIKFRGDWFYPMNGMDASASRRETTFKGQNFETIGVISDSDITAEDLVNDKFKSARIQQWIVDWKYPFHGYFNYSSFILRDHDHDSLLWQAQVEGPVSKLNQTIGHTYSDDCRHSYGGLGCNRILDTDSAASQTITHYNSAGVVTGSVSVNGHPQLVLNAFNQPLGPTPYRNRWMRVDGVRVATPPGSEENTNTSFYLNTADIASDYESNDPALVSAGSVDLWDLQTEGGWFSMGQLIFTSGNLESTELREINFYEQPFGSAYIKVTMRVPLPEIPAVGDTLDIIAGCNRSWTHCRAKNAQVYFFGGFLFIPGPDSIFQRPGSV